MADDGLKVGKAGRTDLVVNALSAVLNAQRRLDTMFPGYYQSSPKHDHYADFGYPTHLTFDDLFKMYRRNGIARAGVEKTVKKSWQDNPSLLESEASDDETRVEGDIRQRFEDLRLWQRLAEVDRRSLVGEYAGAILRLADDKAWREPVDTVTGGLDGLVEIIPAWQGQLKVSNWDADEKSDTYGQPLMYQFIETAVMEGTDAQNKQRSLEIHPDRVVIFSETGDVHGRSLLEAGFNDLLTMEKVSGAGGEGFWKNARSSPHINISPEAKLKDFAAALGVPESEIADKLDEVIGDWQKGFDKAFITQGMEVDTLGITLPQPEEFYRIALQGFAASIDCPMKILVGNQTGERASTEDADEWARTCQSRRVNVIRPNIMAVIQRLELFAIVPERDWNLDWSDLTEADMPQKIDRASKMAEVNAKMATFGRVVFEADEIRETVDLPPLGDRFGDDDDAAVAEAMREVEEAEAREREAQES